MAVFAGLWRSGPCGDGFRGGCCSVFRRRSNPDLAQCLRRAVRSLRSLLRSRRVRGGIGFKRGSLGLDKALKGGCGRNPAPTTTARLQLHAAAIWCLHAVQNPTQRGRRTNGFALSRGSAAASDLGHGDYVAGRDFAGDIGCESLCVRDHWCLCVGIRGESHRGNRAEKLARNGTKVR